MDDSPLIKPNEERVRSACQELMDYNLLFRWFVGMSMDEELWVPRVFTKNRDRLLSFVWLPAYPSVFSDRKGVSERNSGAR